MIKKYKLSFTPEATMQIKNIVLWYNTESKGLGERFKKELKLALEKTKLNPTYSSFRYDEIRYAIPFKFPYAAHYSIDQRLIIIHAVFAFKESPEKWIK